MKMNIFKKVALVSVMMMSAGVLSANTLQDSSEASELQLNSGDYSSDYTSYDHWDRDRRDHDRDRRDRRDLCYDQSVDLVCKVNGRHESVRGYTDCGRSYDGDYCSNIDVPGYRILKMNVTYRCEYGRWRIQNTPGQGCKLTY